MIKKIIFFIIFFVSTRLFSMADELEKIYNAVDALEYPLMQKAKVEPHCMRRLMNPLKIACVTYFPDDLLRRHNQLLEITIYIKRPDLALKIIRQHAAEFESRKIKGILAALDELAKQIIL